MVGSEATLALPLLSRKRVTVDFDGGDLSSDGGVLALALADQRLRRTERLAAWVADAREPAKVKHALQDLFRERIYLIAAGYADANHAQSLRTDPVLKLDLGKEPQDAPLAGQDTLSRSENAITPNDLAQLGQVLLSVFVEQCGTQPQRVVLDFDPFEDPAHGKQQGALFNGHYDRYCYLPLYLCGTVDDG